MMFSLMLFTVLMEVVTAATPNCTNHGYQTFKINSGPDLSNASNCLLTFEEGTLCLLDFCAYQYHLPKLTMVLDGKERRYSGKDSLCFMINYTIPANEFIIKLEITDVCNQTYSHVCKGFGIPSNKTTLVPSITATTIAKTRTGYKKTSRKFENTTEEAHKSIPTVLEVYWYLLLSIPVFLMVTISGTFVIVNMSRKRCFKMAQDQELTSAEPSKVTTKSNQTSAKQSQSSVGKKSKATTRTVSDGDMGPNKHPNTRFESEVDTRAYRKNEDGRSLWSSSGL